MYGIRNILIPTVMSEFIIVVFQVVQAQISNNRRFVSFLHRLVSSW